MNLEPGSTLPNFLVLGTAKAGTSSIYAYLSQHPDVYLSPTTELNFFAHEGGDLNFRGPRDLEYMWADSLVATYAEYRAQFARVSGESAVGEISTHNLYSPQAAARIKHYVPQAKMIAILRHPVDRAFSAFTHMVRDGREETNDFRRGLKLEPRRIVNNWEPLWHYKSMGFYGVQLERFYEIFDAAQLCVYLYDDFVAKPLETIQDIFAFIGVDHSFVPDMSERYNVSYVPEHWQLHKLMTHENVLRSAVRTVSSTNLRSRVRNAVLDRNLKRPHLDSALRRELVEVFRTDILILERLIQRDLSKWLT